MGVEFGFSPERNAYAVWDNSPGGSVIKRFKDQWDIEYVIVEFDKTPGKYYVYYAE